MATVRHCPTSSKFSLRLIRLAATAVFAALACRSALPQSPENQVAKEIVINAVHSELRAAQTDKNLWRYRDEDDDGKRSTYNAIETPQGELRRLVGLNGAPLTPEQQQAETQRIRSFVNDGSAQAKAHKNSQHDDAQASDFLKMLPDAFLWTIVRRSPEAILLSYTPNPAFHPPTIESRVLAAMAGEMEVALAGDRIQLLRGHLTQDVLIGHGIFGRLNQGGTFEVQRRQIEPGSWCITENHVHINGHALLFKSIGQNDDEVKTAWSRSDVRTLPEAARELGVQP